MKRLLQGMLVMLLSVGLCMGCGNASYDAQEGTVFVKKDGGIVSTDVETFDENTYDKAALEDYVKNKIKSYTKEHGADSVELKKLDVKDGSAILTIAYASADDYSRFNGIELFTGTMAEAMSSGYSFDVPFRRENQKPQEATGAERVSVDHILSEGDYQVVVIKGNTTVKVPGKIAFVSDPNTQVTDKDTVVISADNSENKAESTETVETTEATETEEIAETDTQEAVAEDDLLEASEEETEVTFVFDREEPSADSAVAEELSEVYTYIIYQ